MTHNSAAVVPRLLDSIPAAAEPFDVDVVVVDNGSTDDTGDTVAARGDCTLVRTSNVGYAAGINLGVRSRPESSAFLVLNPDVVLNPGFVGPMMRALSLPNTGIVCPRVLNADGSLHYSLRREPSLGRTLGLTATRLAAFAEYVNLAEEYESPRIVDWAVGAVLLFSRECYSQVGGWDESYFLYSEETDFCLRARDLGLHTRYEPRATATHVGGLSGQSDRTHTMQIVNRVRLYRRRHGAVASTIYLLLTALREATWIRRGGSRHTAAIRALLVPSRRPAELGCSKTRLPS